MMPSIEHFQPILVLLGISAAVALTYAAYGRYLQRLTDSTAAMTRVRRSLKIGLPITYVVALLAMNSYGWSDVVETTVAVLPFSDTVLGGGVQLFVFLAAPVIASIAGYFGLFPTIKLFRDVEMTWMNVGLVLSRFLAVLFAFLVVSIFGLRYVVTAFNPVIGLVVGTGCILLSSFACSPYLVRLSRSTRALTPHEEDRIRKILAELDTDVVGIRVLEDADVNQAQVLIRGIPGRRHLLVSDDLLGSVDDERLGAVLAVGVGQARVLHLEVYLSLVVVTGIATVSPLLGSIPVSGPMAWGVSLLIALVGAGVLWVGRTVVFRGDEFAAEHVGENRVADAITWLYEARDVPLSWSRRQMILRMTPSPEQRLRRVTE